MRTVDYNLVGVTEDVKDAGQDGHDWVSFQLKWRELPRARPWLLMDWSELLFLHWEVEANDVARRLPPGLRVDHFDESAWLGVVALRIQRTRPAGLPWLPWVLSFWELNLRTYVKDSQGRPGVYFFSLDASHRLPVWLGRRLTALNYIHSHIRVTSGFEPHETIFQARRRDRVDSVCYHYRPSSSAEVAAPGSLEFFLAERYWWFSWHEARQTLLAGRIWHRPYALAPVKVGAPEDRLLEWNGFARLHRPPDHQMFSASARVALYLPQMVSDED